jgi:hypothetical protein
MTDRARPELLVGKYFIATFPHWDGRVEAMIDDAQPALPRRAMSRQ